MVLHGVTPSQTNLVVENSVEKSEEKKERKKEGKEERKKERKKRERRKGRSWPTLQEVGFFSYLVYPFLRVIQWP